MASAGAIHSLRVPDEVARLIRGLHPAIKRKVRAALQEIVPKPRCGNPLNEELAGLRSFRFGRLGIVYRLADERVIEIVTLGPRRILRIPPPQLPRLLNPDYAKTPWVLVTAATSHELPSSRVAPAAGRRALPTLAVTLRIGWLRPEAAAGAPWTEVRSRVDSRH